MTTGTSRTRYLGRKRRILAFSAAFLTIATCLGHQPEVPSKGVLTARVVSGEGRVVAGAVASIVEVDPHPPKGGAPIQAPEAGKDLEGERACLPDSGKHAVTAADGIFLIEGVNPSAQFKVQVEAKGYRSRALILDPRTPRPLVEFKLVAIPPVLEDRHKFNGQVRLPDGSPAADVVVVVCNAPPIAGGSSRYDTQTKTDQEGRFTLTSEEAWQAMTVTIEAPGCARGKLFNLKAGRMGNTLQLDYGATITGRLMHKAQAVEGVRVSLVAIQVAIVNRWAGMTPPQTSIAPLTSTTDREGRFRFEQVQADGIFYLYTPMRSLLRENLAAIGREVLSPPAGQTLEVGEVNLHPAHRVSGQIFLSDQDTPPKNLYVALERISIHDFQETVIDSQGNFYFDAVPSEVVALSFRSENQQLVAGYRLSSGNLSYDPIMQCLLRGRVDEDCRLNVLLEPGTSRAYRPGELSMQNPAGLAQRQARIVVIQNGKRVIQQVSTVTSVYYDRPLFGISDDAVARLKQKAP